MRLTVYTDYTLRVLMYLGLKADGWATIREISDTYGISKNHLMKIVQDLGREGLVDTVRGKNGGLRLTRPPDQIRIGDIVRNAEADFKIVECFDVETSRCRIQEGCVLAGALNQALAAFLQVLDGYTLADLIGPKRKLAGLLDLAAPAA